MMMGFEMEGREAELLAFVASLEVNRQKEAMNRHDLDGVGEQEGEWDMCFMAESINIVSGMSKGQLPT